MNPLSLLASTLLALTLVACGNSDSDANNDDPLTTESTEELCARACDNLTNACAEYASGLGDCQTTCLDSNDTNAAQRNCYAEAKSCDDATACDAL